MSSSSGRGTWRGQRDGVHSQLRGVVHNCLDALAEAGLVRPELSLEVETSRLHALVDGLALHGVTTPEATTRASPGRCSALA